MISGVLKKVFLEVLEISERRFRNFGKKFFGKGNF